MHFYVRFLLTYVFFPPTYIFGKENRLGISKKCKFWRMALFRVTCWLKKRGTGSFSLSNARNIDFLFHPWSWRSSTVSWGLELHFGGLSNKGNFSEGGKWATTTDPSHIWEETHPRLPWALSLYCRTTFISFPGTPWSTCFSHNPLPGLLFAPAMFPQGPTAHYFPEVLSFTWVAGSATWQKMCQNTSRALGLMC